MDKIEFMYLIRCQIWKIRNSHGKLGKRDKENEMPCSINYDLRRLFDAMVNFFNCLSHIIEKLKNLDVTTNG
jgi:hypothetical protein